MTRHITAAVLGLGLVVFGACIASTTHSEPVEFYVLADGSTAIDPNSELICTMERPTGSMIRKKVCRTRGQIEAERMASQDAMRDAQRMRPNAPTEDGQ